MRRLRVTAAFLAATLVSVALPAATSADPYWHGGGYGWHDDWRAREAWREHEWRLRHDRWAYEHRFYAPPPPYYAAGGYYGYHGRP